MMYYVLIKKQLHTQVSKYLTMVHIICIVRQQLVPYKNFLSNITIARMVIVHHQPAPFLPLSTCLFTKVAFDLCSLLN